MSFTTAALIVAWVAIAILALGFAGLLAQVGELRRALGDQPGTAPGPTASGIVGLRLPATGPLADLQPAGGGLVAFVSPGCASCESVLADLRGRPATSLVVASLGDCPPLDGLDARCVPLTRPDLAQLQVPATPFLMKVDADGTVTDTLLPIDPAGMTFWLRPDAATLPLTHRPKG